MFNKARKSMEPVSKKSGTGMEQDWKKSRIDFIIVFHKYVDNHLLILLSKG